MSIRPHRTEILVVGAGLLGLATAAALTARGRAVTVLEQATIGHGRGSSHGASRIFRLGYADPLYVAMAALAGDRWRQLEAEVGEQLLVPWPQLSFGWAVDDIAAALGRAGSRPERLARDDIDHEFPGFAAPGDGLLEPDSGVLLADRCLRALQTRATGGSGEVREGVTVEGIVDDGRRVTITSDGGAHEAGTVVLCPGAWSAPLAGPLLGAGAVPFTTTLEHVAYVAPIEGHTLDALPIFIDHDEPSAYGLPTPTMGRYKIAAHHAGPEIDPVAAGAAGWSPRADAAADAVALARRRLPGCDAGGASVEVCPYDNTPDEDFVLDRVGNVVVGAGTSGHGFKFGPLLGEILADLATGAEPSVDLARFSAHRAARPATPF